MALSSKDNTGQRLNTTFKLKNLLALDMKPLFVLREHHEMRKRKDAIDQFHFGQIGIP